MARQAGLKRVTQWPEPLELAGAATSSDRPSPAKTRLGASCSLPKVRFVMAFIQPWRIAGCLIHAYGVYTTSRRIGGFAMSPSVATELR